MSVVRWSCLFVALFSNVLFGQNVETIRNISYKPEASNEYERERCTFDLVVPSGKNNFATLIWFHGGGLESGDKVNKIAEGVNDHFTKAGMAVASVNYRLSPKVTYPAYIDDAAAAVVRIRQEVTNKGGDATRVFVSGHSAGAYLTTMLAVAPEYLLKYHAVPQDFAGYLPVSGQMFTHYTIRKERGIPKTQPMIDSAAPTWHVQDQVPPILAVWGSKDLPTRAEENQYFVAAMREAGNKDIQAYQFEDRTHDSIASQMNQAGDEVASMMDRFIAQHRSRHVACKLRVEQTDTTLTVKDGDREILVYNKVSPPAPKGIDAIYERSGFVHPVFAPNGEIVTAAFPADHPHQHGVFSAWVKTKYAGKQVDFWNLAGRTGYALHERVVATFQTENSAGFEVDLLHRVASNPPVDVLREHWKLTVQPTDGTYNCFDLETTQHAITDLPLVVEKYHYGGVAVRGPTSWLLANDADRRSSSSQPNDTCFFLNSLGQDRIAGNHAHAKWVALSGQLNGKSASIIVFDHPQNFRSPQASRLHPTKPYFCFSPCVDGEFVIDKSNPYRARYRFIVTSEAPDAKWLDSTWNRWINQDIVAPGNRCPKSE